MARTIQMALNRVEGDLEVKVKIDDGIVTDAWMIGTMYRGIEKMMAGRAALDGLVITPRVCGICSTSHLLAAARALENLSGVAVSYNGRLLRHLALGAEKLQNDVRHVALMFAADLTNKRYQEKALHKEAVRRFQPFSGKSVVEVIRASKKIPEIIAILGGQWPHSSFIVPGGITSEPSGADMRQCRMLLSEFRRWYETYILGCSVERWQQVRSPAQLDSWLEEKSHFESDLGFLIRCGREFGLDSMGRGHESFLAVPEHDLPGTTSAGAVNGGVVSQGNAKEFIQEKISEQIRYSYYLDNGHGAHPMNATTRPYVPVDSKKYSWCKAPRYDEQAVETGPLAELMVNEDALFQALVKEKGSSALVRELARLTRPARLLPLMEEWFTDIDMKAPFYQTPGEFVEGEGFGLVQAPRGILGHWLKLSHGRIEHYQIISPTTWNASPRDNFAIRGPIEEALIGTPVQDPNNPVEVGHVVRSFDLCMVCSVHAVSKNGSSLGRVRLGAG
jgi:uptake hydrogenase large subunit